VSLRLRLTLLLAAGFAALLLGGAFFVARAVEGRMTEDFDAALLAEARALVSLVEEEQGRIEFDYTAGVMPQFEREERPDLFQFWLDDGRVLMRSSRLVGDLPRPAGAIGESPVEDAARPDGRSVRVARVSFVPKSASASPDPGDEAEPAPPANGPSTPPRAVGLSVARGRENLDAMVAGIRLAVFGTAAVATLLAVLLVWRVLAAGFRPVDSIARQVEHLDADRLGSRVVVPRAPRELAGVVAEVNALLDRLSATVERERRFAGNVAHELRTPIAELRSLADVARRWPDDPAAVSAFFDDVAVVAKRMESLVGDLLLLARCHAGVEAAVREPVALRDAVLAAWAPLEERARECGLSLALDVAEGTVVESDPTKLSIVLANLLGNAVDYARRGTGVRVGADRAGGRVRIEVANEAEALGPEGLARLTEPFWRGDPARASSSHAGLGLSLVAALAPLLRMTVRFDQDDRGTFRVRLEVPASDAVPALRSAPSPYEPDLQPALRMRPEHPPYGGPA
jgi:two-component system sensor histidine kinase QseC